MQYKYKKERKPLFPKKQKEIKIKEPKSADEKKTIKKTVASSVSFFLAVAIVCGSILYFNSYTRPSSYPEGIPESITIETGKDGSLIFVPDNPMAVLIFYPENRIDFKAYENLMIYCAQYRILSVLVKIPLHQSAFGKNSADTYVEKYADYDNIFVGGHGKGGAAAAEYALENADKLNGVVLLSSYSEKDISDSGLSVISIYGSEDRILNSGKYEKYKANLPDCMTEHIINGGNHSLFGSYGMQKGDGEALIGYEDQLSETAAILFSHVLKNFRYK